MQEIKKTIRMCLCPVCKTIQKDGTKCGICSNRVIAKPIERTKAPVELTGPVNAFWSGKKK